MATKATAVPTLNPYTGTTLSAKQQATLAKQQQQLGTTQFAKAYTATQESAAAQQVQKDIAALQAKKAGKPAPVQTTPTATKPAPTPQVAQPPPSKTEAQVMQENQQRWNKMLREREEKKAKATATAPALEVKPEAVPPPPATPAQPPAPTVPAAPKVPTVPKEVKPGEVPEIYKPGTVSGYTKAEADQIYQDVLARKGGQPLPDTMEEAEAIRVARGQMPAKDQPTEEVVPVLRPPSPPPTLPEVPSETLDSGMASIDRKGDIRKAINENQNLTMEEELNNILNMPADSTGAGLLKESLKLKLGILDDPDTNKFLDTMEARAKASYESGLAMAKASEAEINKAIEGTLKAPTTGEGLMAKIYKETEEQQLASIAEEKEYQGKRHELEMKQLRENRADLEGFTKAKLYSMGAQDSSAGVSLLSKVVSQADMNIELAEIEYNHGQKQLNLESRKIISDFGNSVAEIVMKTEEQKDVLLGQYNEQLDKIDEERFMNEREKKKAKMEAVSEYVDKVHTYEQEAKQQQFEELKFAYQQQQDSAEKAFKMSGIMGTLYVPDQNGNLVDTGMPTLEYTKNKWATEQEERRFQMDVLSERRSQVETLFSTFRESGWTPEVAASMEQMLGLSQGEISQFGNIQEAENYVNGLIDTADTVKGYVDANSPTGQCPQAIKDIFGVGGSGGWCGVFATTISTATTVGNMWADKIDKVRKAGDIRENPQPGYKLLLPLGVKTGSGRAKGEYGHVATVLSYDPNTGNMLTVESNSNGAMNRTGNPKDGKITIEQYNINDFSIYGNNWGFVPGEFKPGIKKKLMALGPETTSFPVEKKAIDWGKLATAAKSLAKSVGGVVPTSELFKKAKSLGMSDKAAQEWADESIKQQLAGPAGAAQKPLKPPTETERTTAAFAQRTKEANEIFDQLADKIEKQDFFTFQYQRSAPNALKSSEMQQQEQAERNFINAVLRKESGAAISPDEFKSQAIQYFPQPGDTEAVLKQKKQNRLTAMKGLELAAGSAAYPDIPSAQKSGLASIIGGFFSSSRPTTFSIQKPTITGTSGYSLGNATGYSLNSF